ncbi:hypothetical protein HMPREF9098_1081 [Kingella denitrificans ATCC 33394]|uniref:Uncharacterized protein n=1 Tax=Kingella denitrificans ATCC 33394 TaxID=888741 RepID=F0EYZ7_9NEIS|nr:hypothetical protein HMPREF9098_1081 [Kingella denitrificans ATCC 33394]
MGQGRDTLFGQMIWVQAAFERVKSSLHPFAKLRLRYIALNKFINSLKINVAALNRAQIRRFTKIPACAFPARFACAYSNPTENLL